MILNICKFDVLSFENISVVNKQVNMAKFKSILDKINSIKKSNQKIELKFSKDDIFKLCEIRPKDKIYNYDIGYISKWVNTYLKYHIPEIKVLLYNEWIYITDNLKVTYDNVHTRYPSGNMYKHKFDFEIKRLHDKDFINYKKCGLSNTIIPECGVYIITTEKGKYIGSSTKICNRLRQHISNNVDIQEFRKTIKMRSPIMLITIYECPGLDRARYLEDELIAELHPKLNCI